MVPAESTSPLCCTLMRVPLAPEMADSIESLRKPLLPLPMIIDGADGVP